MYWPRKTPGQWTGPTGLCQIWTHLEIVLQWYLRWPLQPELWCPWQKEASGRLGGWDLRLFVILTCPQTQPTQLWSSDVGGSTGLGELGFNPGSLLLSSITSPLCCCHLLSLWAKRSGAPTPDLLSWLFSSNFLAKLLPTIKGQMKNRRSVRNSSNTNS